MKYGNKIKKNKMVKIKQIVKLSCIIVFLYVAFFSIQSFWQGFHDLDIAFNFLNLGMSQDINTDGQIITLSETYLRGLSRMEMAFIWLSLDSILGVIVGYLFK